MLGRECGSSWWNYIKPKLQSLARSWARSKGMHCQANHIHNSFESNSILRNGSNIQFHPQPTMIELSRTVFRRGVDAVLPGNLINHQVERNGNVVSIRNHQCFVNLDAFQGVHIIGFGKAVLPMAEELVQILTDRLGKCVLSVPVGTREPKDGRIEIHHGALNNLPDENSFNAAKRIVEIASSCTKVDVLFILISGGGSALLPYPKSPITLQEKTNLIRQLSRNGATIHQLNEVRRKISAVKGGGLLHIARNTGQIISLLLSDVLGNDLGTIASGPTVPPSQLVNCGETALQIIQRFNVDIPLSIRSVLESIDTEVESYPIYKTERLTNAIVGSNQIALEAAAQAANDGHLIPIILTSTLEGEARVIGGEIAELCYLTAQCLKSFKSPSSESILAHFGGLFKQLKIPPGGIERLVNGIIEGNQQHKGLCLLIGGETTVTVKGSGIGGRNQELALAAALKLDLLAGPDGKDLIILSGGTDGIDGPCDAAGAIATSSTVLLAKQSDLSPTQFLDDNNSYNFFKKLCNGDYHLITGHTETNVMDLVIGIIPFSTGLLPANSSQ